MDKFHLPTVRVPPYISQMSNLENLLNPSDDTDSGTGTGRGKGKGKGKGKPKPGEKNYLGAMISNKKVLPRLCITAEEYSKKLSHDKHLAVKPKKCVKWHVRGLCFDQVKRSRPVMVMPHCRRQKRMKCLRFCKQMDCVNDVPGRGASIVGQYLHPSFNLQLR
jgi:hypothetical protein